MDPISKDLARWVPRLIAVWRSRRKPAQQSRRPQGTRGRDRRVHPHAYIEEDSRLPADRLTPDELREVSAGIRTLSMGLTRDRELAGARYMDDPKLLGAYLLFYWPVSYAQARNALRELRDRPRSVLDLGSGPGPLSFAALDHGAGEVVAADRSAAALELVKALALEAGEGMGTRQWNAMSGDAPPDGSFDLVSMGHVLNELWAGKPDAIDRRASVVEKAFARVKPNGSMLILEPALRETSRNLLHLRDVLVDRGYGVRAPCLFKGHCPALVKETDWCHAERSWDPPPLINDLSRAAGLHKEALKMSYLLLAPKGQAVPEVAAPEGAKLFRIVSEPLASKGRLRYMGCGPDGRVGLALQEKHVAEPNRAFERLYRGDVIAISGTEDRGDGLALGEGSRVEVVAHAGQPVPSKS